MKHLLLLPLIATGALASGFPVFDAANLTAQKVAHAESITKWVDSIAKLRTQIDQLNQQINIQGDIRKWTGNPVEAGANVVLDVLGEEDLVREYGRARDEIIRVTRSLDSLENTTDGNYRAIRSTDLNGGKQIQDVIARDGFYVRVPAGKQF